MSRPLSKTGHVSDDELIDRLYGLAPAAGTAELHLANCADCADKLRLFEQRRAAALGVQQDVQAVPPAFLAAQRNRILERVEQRPGFRMPWVPAVLAGAAVAAVALVPHMVQGPTPASPKTAQQEVVEDQLLREVFSLERAEEPRAAAPIRGLFEAAGSGEQQ